MLLQILSGNLLVSSLIIIFLLAIVGLSGYSVVLLKGLLEDLDEMKSSVSELQSQNSKLANRIPTATEISEQIDTKKEPTGDPPGGDETGTGGILDTDDDDTVEGSGPIQEDVDEL